MPPKKTIPENQNQETTGVKALMDKINNIANDLATLDVITLTGDINLEKVANQDTVDFEKLYKNIGENVKNSVNVDVVAFTHIELDCDSVMFVKRGIGESEKVLLEVHNETIKTAQETRLGVVRLVKDIIGI